MVYGLYSARPRHSSPSFNSIKLELKIFNFALRIHSQMKKQFSVRIRNLFTCKASASDSETPKFSTNVDFLEEYANAFRTESYNEFWTRVLAHSHPDSATSSHVGQSATAARLPSYRLFAEHLLDPDQPTVNEILALARPRNRPEYHLLLSDYFSETASASLLCGLLLKDIDHTRVQYRHLKTTLNSLQTVQLSLENRSGLIQLSESLNRFGSLAASRCRFRAVQASCSGLLRRLESGREKARSKLRLVNRLKLGSAVFIVALTASVVVIVSVTTHAFAMLVAVPGFMATSLKAASSSWLATVSAQLDSAAKGTYILNRDLDTISRLVIRLHDELEHVRHMVRFWLDRRDDRLHATGEMARQLKKNDSSFSQQLDELEEHLYLCFMTINRARSLVMKEVLDLSRV